MVALAVVAGASAAAPAAAPQSPVLAIEWGQDRAQTLVRVDPVTLARAGGGLPLPAETNGWAFSPDGAEVAFGSVSTESAFAGIRIVDPHTLQLVREIDMPKPGAYQPLAWLAPDRLLVLRSFLREQIVLIDPTTGRESVRVNLKDVVVQVGRTPTSIVLLTAPSRKLGRPRLLVLDGAEHSRAVVLRRLRAGVYIRHVRDVFERRIPGLAVDPAGHAYVFAAGGVAADVDLGSLTATYHRLGAPGLQTFKAIEGWQRSARWLENGSVVLAGSSSHVTRSRQMAFEPAGVALVDVRGWTERMLSASSAWFLVGDGVLVAPDPAATPTRLLTYDFDGRAGPAVDPGGVGLLSVAGRYAYSWDPTQQSTRVIDLSSGAVVNRVRSPLLTFVDGDAPFFA